MLTIKSRSHDYTVESFTRLTDALASVTCPEKSFYLIDSVVARIYADELGPLAKGTATVVLEATESQKAFEKLTSVFLELIQKGIKRDSNLVVIGGGVLQDIGCFIASVLSRGLRWELIPTTLLAQADSCIGSKSSINIGPYKNQIGTFYPPCRVLLTSSVLQSLPEDEIHSGLGEIIKLQLLDGQAGFEELMADLAVLDQENRLTLLGKWIIRSMAVKQPYIEKDEYDKNIRNLLNYGHTFGHAYESATHYSIPHGIAVILGMLTATYVSAHLGLVSWKHYDQLKSLLHPWCKSYGEPLRKADKDSIYKAIRHDKKNTGESINCILTEGFGAMKKMAVDFDKVLVPCVARFIDTEI